MSCDTRRSSISSDWEELDAVSGCYGSYDDTASIVSLASTLTDSEDSDALPEPTTLPIRERVLESTDLPRYVDDDTDSVASDETITEDLLDVVVEPSMLLSSLESLQSILSEIIPSGGEQDSSHTQEAASGLLEALHRLLGTIIDLKEVVSGYAKVYEPDDPFSAALQLDPLLYKWCTTCALKLYKLQAEENLAVKSESYSNCINKLCEDLGVFLPIFRVDLDEYQISQLIFPRYPADELPSHEVYLHRRHRSSNPEPLVEGAIPDLRRQLYALKDEIGKTSSIIRDCIVTEAFTADMRTQLHEIQALQTHTFETLGVLLSNHGSDWIEQTIAGGLSYADFTSLDRKNIQAFTERISKFGCLLNDLRISSSYKMGDFEPIKSRKGVPLSGQKYGGPADAPSEDGADFISTGLGCEGFKAILLDLNSTLKVEVLKE
ncbi:hypothetical protein FKW77_005344 [Venturia effusa]|uniref:Uncharacterized protein n=1 Tax=Venturia effusa TaxID=50376 RepID=A0A517LP06_9PEZI|nr:hypothetical protein FKW77_005344 [Venturia effusa]